jgi:HAD superfamily hydrolase (TIGR01509 family)
MDALLPIQYSVGSLMNPIRAAIFDFDGTLVDSLPATVEAFNAVVAPFLGTRLTVKEVRGVTGPNHRKILSNFLPADRVDEGMEKLRVELLSQAEGVRAYPGVADMITDLRARGCALALATLRDPESTNRILEVAGLSGLFHLVICGDVIKPGPGGNAIAAPSLLKIAEELLVTPEQATFIGDSTADLEAGRKAGMRTAAVSWGYQRREDLTMAGPDFLFEPLIATL